MRVSIEKIREALETALKKRGVEEKMIKILASDYLEGELQGKESHGLMAFPSFLDSVERMKGRQEKIIKETHSLIIMDADTLPGSYIGRTLADKLIEKAKKEGVGIGAILNMKTWLRPSIIAQYITERGMIGLVINNGGVPMVAPPGGYEPVVGTNPIGIGIPSEKAPIVIDMATSKRAWGEVRKAKRLGTDLPQNTFFSKAGEYTVNPDDAYSVQAMGDYKGFALALFIEMMTGSFLGRPMLNDEIPDSRDYQARMRGAIVMVFDPDTLSSLEKMQKENTALVQFIKKGNTLPGVDEILIPGERAMRTRQRNFENGYLEIEEELWNKIIV